MATTTGSGFLAAARSVASTATILGLAEEKRVCCFFSSLSGAGVVVDGMVVETGGLVFEVLGITAEIAGGLAERTGRVGGALGAEVMATEDFLVKKF